MGEEIYQGKEKLINKKSEDQTYCFSQSTTLNNNESI